VTAVFYISAMIAIIATVFAISRRHPVHALLYLIVSLLALAVVFYLMGAPFVAALELIIYAGAIMVLFVFVVMMLNLGESTKEMERDWLRPSVWIGPSLLGALLIIEQGYLIVANAHPAAPRTVVGAKQVGIALFGPYVIGVELASLLLMGGLIGAYHLGRRTLAQEEELYGARTTRARAAVSNDPVRTGSDRTSHAA
jgi:NADH-quinone oxidoreductase subunit J